ncbi:MAG: hypothetical protein JSV12_06085 [Candidatus Bathyarchaeota archaeon]|nr:MAG: hypothetical protein JSV12_06085 [Candidatus Bathyarchaeota archaeon]
MSATLKKIKEFYTKLRKERGVLLPAWREVSGETPTISFSELISAYLRDPACKAFVDFLADQTVGAGFYTTVNSEYARAEEAKQAVDDFSEAVNLDGLLQIGAREIVATGNSFWEKIEPSHLEQLRILPLTSVEKIVRDQYGNVKGYRQTASYGGKTLQPENITHFKWIPVNGEAFGTGVLQSLCETLSFNGETRMSFLEMKARIEKVMPEIFEKYAGPDELWLFPGVSADKLAEYQRLIKSKPKAGARFVYDRADADIKTVAVDPRARYEAYVEHILNQVYLGGQTPLPKLFTTPGFTEASARAALRIAERKVMALQRFIKRIVEREIFAPLIQQTGLDSKKAGCRLNWGIPETPEITLAEVIRLSEISANTGVQYIRPDEVRKILVKMGFELTESEEAENTVRTST